MDFGDGQCLETGRIEIIRYITPSGEDVITTIRGGDAEHLLIALGMLAMAQDNFNQPEYEDDDDE